MLTYFTPEYTNAWAAMFIQSALIYAYYLLPLSIVVVCVMVEGRETGNRGILKMLSLPLSRHVLSAAKFCILLFYLFLEMLIFLVIFLLAGIIATRSAGITETLPITDLIKWSAALFVTMLPSTAAMWAITILLDKPLLSAALNLLLIIPGVLIANTPLWIAYPYCYSGYLVSQSLHAFTPGSVAARFPLFPFLPCAVLIFIFTFTAANLAFGRKETR